MAKTTTPADDAIALDGNETAAPRARRTPRASAGGAGGAVESTAPRGKATAASRAAKAGRHVTPAPVAQQYLLNAAVELFHAEGVRAVGVDAVVKRAGVNKMCLYRQYSSKDELILAYLDYMHERSLSFMDAAIASQEGDPRAQMLQVFLDLATRASKPGYRGCPFVNVAAEFPDPEHPARKAVLGYKAEVIQRFTRLAEAASAGEPDALVAALCLILDGAYTSSQTHGAGSAPLLAAPRVAQLVIDASLPAKG